MAAAPGPPARRGAARCAALFLLVVAVVLGALAVGAAVSWETRPLLRARHALQSALGRDNVAVTLHIDGVGAVPMFLDPHAAVFTSYVEQQGIWEPRETEIFVKQVGEGDVVVDVGANVGYYTLLAGHLVGPGGRVYAFEPDPRNFAYLERNVRLNGLDNVVLEQKAVSDRDGTLQLFVTEGAHEDSRIVAPSDRPSTPVDVEAVALDEYFRGREERLDFVKIDVQGAEGVVLSGMERIAEASPDLGMVLELSPGLVRESGVDPDALADRLARTFRIFTFDDVAAPIEPAALKNAAWHSANLFLARRDGRRDAAAGTIAAERTSSRDVAAADGRRRMHRARMGAVKADPERFFDLARRGDTVVVFEDGAPVLRIAPPDPARQRPPRARRSKRTR